MESFERRRGLKDELAELEKIVEHYGLQVEKLHRESNLGKRFKSRTFETFEADGYEKQLKTAEAFADGNAKEGVGLIISGSVGTGKTHLAAGIVNRLIERGIPTMFVTAIELFELLRDFEQVERLKRVKKVAVLVIDDLGKEKITDWNREKLFEIINSRYEDYLPVVITTNCTSQELLGNVGDAVYSRLCEMCAWLTMSGKDYRRQK